MSDKNQRGKRASALSESTPLNADQILMLVCKGPIGIKGRDGSDVIVRGQGEMTRTQDEKQVTIQLDGPISALVPRNARLRLDIDGPVSIKEVNDSDIEILSLDGPLTIRGAASLSIRDADGPLTIFDVRDAVTIEQVDGPITLSQIGGNITIDQGDGPLTARKFQGDLQASLDGNAFLDVTGQSSQRLTLRVDGDVVVKTPATTRMAGVVQADGDILIELAQQRIETRDETITLSQIDEAAPLVSVDIKADGNVYIGPNPPDAGRVSSGFHFLGLGRLLGRRRGRRKVKVQAAAAPTAEPEGKSASKEDKFADERKIILRMVAEGKLTAEEGDQLLEALE